MALMLAVLTSCEKAVLDESSYEEASNVVLRITSFEQIPFSDNNVQKSTRSTQQSITELCTRISFVFFKGDEKVKDINQETGDESFGSTGVNLSEGTYQLVVIAHNGEGKATVSSPTNITFGNNKPSRVTDTFYYYGEITVGSEDKEYCMNLKRAVAMFRLSHTSDLPSGISKVKFYYTYGSSALDATTGKGCANSRQTVYIPIEGNIKQFDLYTFPHEEEDSLKMKITSLDSNDQTIQEHTFEDVPVTRNKITRYTGDLFNISGGTSSKNQFPLTADGEWAAENEYKF